MMNTNPKSNNIIDVASSSDTLSPKIEGIEDDEIYVKSVLELGSIRIYNTNFNTLKIDSFKLIIFSEYKPTDTFVFKGNVAPNIFKGYQLYTLDKNNIEQSDYIGFSITVYYSDLKKRIYESRPKRIYFSVLRSCINGTKENKK